MTLVHLLVKEAVSNIGRLGPHYALVYRVPSDCTKVLIEYLKSYTRSENDFLFTTLSRRNQLTPGDLRKILRTVAARQLGTRRVYPHLLRHSLATNLLNRGASLITIKDQLGLL